MNLQPLLDAINDRNIVSGLTHDIYRYPARFSPLFARTAIELFTEPGDSILDPFMGGSTSLVEALALGRHAVGTDLNQLAVFLARVKTLLVTDEDLESLRIWAELIAPELSPRKPVVRHTYYQALGYQTNMPWRFRKIAEQAINSAMDLLEGDLLLSARCIILKTVQWAVDCKKALPTAAEFRAKIVEDTRLVADGLKALRQQVDSLQQKPATIEAHHCATDSIGSLKSKLLQCRPPRLVVTSPPYPGVHVLYHRWQVLGRRETAAPYWITESNDGQGGSFYTFCDRRRLDHDEKYFGRLFSCFTAIRSVVPDDCVVAQLVGFARPNEQLALYLDAMSRAGFAPFEFKGSSRPSQEEFWRAVPNRKWYNNVRHAVRQSKEILLLHRAR
ncbi:DNA methyltransferase [Singulisphaera sp. PoT]|uniref:DNA methyltransferase n=1 Tax=Singulisphaera sp. PoT TaxID=3411797 RepID=UPI003BF5BA2A